MSYAERMRSKGARADRFGSMQPPKEFIDYYKSVYPKNIAEGQYPSRLMPINPTCFPDQPCLIRKHRIELEKGEKPKMVLGSDSHYEGLSLGDPPIVLDRLLLGLNTLCWVIEEKEIDGKKRSFGRWEFPSKLAKLEGFQNAINLVLPWDEYMYMLLMRAEIEEMKSKKKPEPGAREWKNYSLSPADKDLPIENWVPVLLCTSARGFYDEFVDAIDTAAGFNKGKYEPWDRRKGAHFIFKRGKANAYGMGVRANPGIEIGTEQWKDLMAKNHYPDFSRKVGWMTKDNASTDETIIANLEESWWFGKLLKHVPEIAEYLDGDHDEELDPEDDEEEFDSDDDED